MLSLTPGAFARVVDAPRASALARESTSCPRPFRVARRAKSPVSRGVVASARVEGDTDGLDALAVAKRELAAVLPLLKPTRKLFAEVSPYMEPDEEQQLPERLHLLSSLDESSYFDSVEADVERAFERVTGERLASVRR